MLHATTRWSTRVAKGVIAISEATRRDLIARYDVPAERIQVIHHGVDHSMHPASRESIIELQHRLGLPEAYVLVVGTIQPRKNLERLVEAMSSVANAGLPHQLVIAGKRGWLATDVEAHIAKSPAANRVHYLGYVAASELPTLYSGAAAFCFPSLYEGFGLPVLEAMACGTPVVTANTSALPEVAGDAALLVDPADIASIGAALVRVLTDDSLRRDLTARGLARAAQFTWERSAEATIGLLRQVRDGRA
jgi:glycosyltransferase involved in cell wall biosynthesis